MEHRLLGSSGLKVPALSLGTATFGGGTELFRKWGNTGVTEARRMVELCLDAGLNFFDSADGYSDGLAETILGEAISGRRERVIISTKGTFRTGPLEKDIGASRHHIIDACNASLRRLRTDYVDIYFLHGFDALTPVDEQLRALEDLVRAGKVRTIGCSNFSGWHLMKSLDVSERYGIARHAVHQVYYSLIAREYEWELMPLGLAHNVAGMVWSPLAAGRLSGKIRRGQPASKDTRAGALPGGLDVPDEHLFRVIDALDVVAKDTGKSVPQVALNWLLQRPTIANIVIGARNEEQLRHNLGAVGWNLTKEQVATLDAASTVKLTYPYWHQRGSLPDRNPPPV